MGRGKGRRQREGKNGMGGRGKEGARAMGEDREKKTGRGTKRGGRMGGGAYVTQATSSSH